MNNRIFGYEWEEIKAMQQKQYKAKPIKKQSGDHGADPIGNGLYKMVPSGDIVTYEERKRRLAQ